MPELFYRMERTEPCTAEQFLRHDCGLSRRQLSRLKAMENGLTVNGRHLRSIDTVYPGEVITVRMKETAQLMPNPALHVPLVFSDTDVLFFNKPAGMPVHPSLHHNDDTLGNAFAAAYPELVFRPLYRLDNNTSGLVAAARHQIAAAQLPGRFRKTYLALVTGDPPDAGSVDAPIGRADGSIITRCITSEGKPAVTHFRTVSRGRYALLSLWLETGRTHQIRVHLAHIGCPLAGDDLYGGSMEDIDRHALHCAAVDYADLAGAVHHITSPLPEDMRRLASL